MTITYWLVVGRSVSIWRRVTIAAVVEPVGRKANWSVNWRAGGGDKGDRYWRTTSCSMIRVRTGITEIGWKYACSLGADTFWIGLIQACFHWSGTVDVSREKLKRSANGLLNIGAAILRNQEGKSSSPVEVGRRLSRMWNTSNSVMYWNWFGWTGTVCFVTSTPWSRSMLRLAVVVGWRVTDKRFYNWRAVVDKDTETRWRSF